MEPFAKRPRVGLEGGDAIAAEDAITFHVLGKDRDGQVILEENSDFPPEMTHQLFGEKEEIVGYDGLSIDIWLTPQFQAFMDVKYASKGAGATELKAPLQEAFEAGFFEEKAQFDKALQGEAGIDLKTLGREVAVEETNEGPTLRVFHSQLSTADPALKKLHARLQPLLYFFVDAASAIDQEDPGWHLLTAVETSPEGVKVLGFATAYRLYHYPEGARLKLAQILVLPPHQGRGAGSLLLTGAQALADELDACDLAFEDPAEALQALRTTLDVRRALELDWLQAAAAERIAALAADKGKGPAVTANGGAKGSSKSRKAARAAAQHPLAAPAAVLARLRSELRLSKLQAAAVWPVVLYVVGKAEQAVVAGVESMVRQNLVASMAATKENAQDKSLRETEKGFVMCRGASEVRRELPLLPVEEQSAEQQAEGIETAAEQEMEAVAAVARKFLGGEEDEEGNDEDDGSDEEDEE